MSSITLTSTSTTTHYINIVATATSYTVSVYPQYNDDMCGYVIKQRSTTDRVKAMRIYNKYVKEYK